MARPECTFNEMLLVAYMAEQHVGTQIENFKVVINSSKIIPDVMAR
jgi:hypothetical protein